MTDAYVTTFYSFKGGVGRTTLLANVAHVLAAADERVLIWDLDLEAPGVHHFPGLEPPERVWQAGFLEWLGDHPPPSSSASPDGAWPDDAALATLAARVYPARGPGHVLVLPAHGTDADLGRAYAAVDWHGLFVDDPARGLHLFRQVCAALVARFTPSFVLIDARTGVSDLGAVLTGFLPDCTVLVGNYGRQSTAGLAAVYLGLDRFAGDTHADFRRRRLERVLVASPVPGAPAMLERGRAAWQDRFPGVGPRALAEVPLVENLLYAEDILVRSAPSSDAARAYRLVARHLIDRRRARARVEAPLREGAGFDERARRLLRLLGFELGNEQGVVRAREKGALGERRYLVAIRPGSELTRAAVAELVERLRGRRERERDAGEALIVTDAASADVQDAARTGGARLFTLGELERQLVDLPAYAAWLRQGWEDSPLARAYVAPRVRAAAPAADGDDALAHALRWVAGEGPRLMVVVGDDGGGKSSFVRRLAYELALRAARDPDAVVPLLVDLRAAAPTSMLELVGQHLRGVLGWRGSPEALAYLLAAGRIVLLLDGFDELATAAGAAEQLRLLAHLTDEPALAAAGNRVLVTGRPALLSDDDPAARAEVATLELAPFGPGEISQYLANRLGRERASKAFDAITQTRAIATLAPRPMLLELLAEGAVALASGDEPITVAGLFTRHVEAWLADGGAAAALTAAQRTALVERLAAELWRLGDVELPAAPLVSLVQGRDADLRALAADVVDRELRTARFLVRSPAGGFRFVHRQFLEYFLARHLLASTRGGPAALARALTTERLSPASAALFAELVAGAPADVRDDARAAVAAVADDGEPREAAENAARLVAALPPAAPAEPPPAKGGKAKKARRTDGGRR